MNLPTSRGSPANTDAEEAVLASLMLDDSPDQWFVGKCLDYRLSADWFFAPKNAAIFQAVNELVTDGQPHDEIAVCERLSKKGTPDNNLLDMVGGHAEICRLTNRVETIAGAVYWLDIVRDKATARKLIAAGTSLVERIHANDDPKTALERTEEALANIAQLAEPEKERKEGTKAKREAVKLAKVAEAHRFDVRHPPVEEPPILLLAGHPLAHAGDIVAFIAPQKSGKTSSIAALIASFMGDLRDSDCLGFQGDNRARRTILHFDTEQSKRDHWHMMNRTLRRACRDDFPDWFASYHVRQFKPEDRLAMILALSRKAHKENGLLAVCIDGVADLLNDFNDVRESTALITAIMALCEETGAALICSLHVNPGQTKDKPSEKARGHLGTMLEQKATSIILLEKKEDKNNGREVTTIRTKDGRHGLAKNPPCFAWSDEHKMHRTIAAPITSEGSDEHPADLHEAAKPRPSKRPIPTGGDGTGKLSEAEIANLPILAASVWQGWAAPSMNWNQLCDAVKEVQGCPVYRAKSLASGLVKAGHIQKLGENDYRLPDSL